MKGNGTLVLTNSTITMSTLCYAASTSVDPCKLSVEMGSHFLMNGNSSIKSPWLNITASTITVVEESRISSAGSGPQMSSDPANDGSSGGGGGHGGTGGLGCFREYSGAGTSNGRAFEPNRYGGAGSDGARGGGVIFIQSTGRDMHPKPEPTPDSNYGESTGSSPPANDSVGENSTTDGAQIAMHMLHTSHYQVIRARRQSRAAMLESSNDTKLLEHIKNSPAHPPHVLSSPHIPISLSAQGSIYITGSITADGASAVKGGMRDYAKGGG